MAIADERGSSRRIGREETEEATRQAWMICRNINKKFEFGLAK